MRAPRRLTALARARSATSRLARAAGAADCTPEPDSTYFQHGRLRAVRIHHSIYLCSLPNALISTSTPAGRSSFMSASTVCGVGSKMSMSRLCVRISNCSRDFLSTCGDRSTVHLLIDVGSGIGPASRAPVRLAVSTISPVDWSRMRESYAFKRMRILSENIAMSFYLARAEALALLNNLGD